MNSTRRGWLLFVALTMVCVFCLGCGSKSAEGDGGGSGGSATDGGSGYDGPTTPGPDVGVVTQLDGGPSETGLPALPVLTNVFATQREDSVGIDFDPVDNAVDYRVYPLPSPGDLTVNSDGSLIIKNAIYRCAGLRQAFELPNATLPPSTDGGQDTVNQNQQYSWIATVPANPTLGYVYPTEGPGLVPVYAIAVHPAVPEVGWRESRPKIYTTSASLRQTWLSQGARDDGIVFYVPSSASSSTETLYHSETAIPVGGQNWTQYTEYYFTKADLAAHAMDSTPPAPAFQILSAAAEGAKPLMAVFYQPGMNHTELAVGNERFTRAAHQSFGPLWHLEWSGITAETTLVVEALSSGCPYQGFLSPQSIDAPPHQPLETLAQLQAASTTGEVFINGQYDVPGASWTVLNPPDGGYWGTSSVGLPALETPNASPVPIARSFVKVMPLPHNPSDWDWYEGFNVGTDFGTVVPGQDPANCTCQNPGSPFPCQNGSGGCGYWTSPTLDIGAYELDIQENNVPVFAYGQFLGQFWDAFDDTGQDVTGSVRFTAPMMATVDSDPNKFIELTWSVNTVSTGRRYPQLIVSDQSPPVEDGFDNPNSNTLLIQTRLGPSMLLEVQAFHGLVNGKPWAVNNQSIIHAIIDYDTWNGNYNGIPSSATNEIIPPADPPFEHAGMDRMTQYVAYISSNRVYVFMDGAPAGCTQYPTNAGFALNGQVSVTFGDVIYHEGAPDELICSQAEPYAFMHQHQCSETTRHWDDLGFKSGVAPPAWDATKFPCQAFCTDALPGGGTPGGC